MNHKKPPLPQSPDKHKVPPNMKLSSTDRINQQLDNGHQKVPNTNREQQANTPMGIKNIHMKIGSNTFSKKQQPGIDKLNIDLMDSNFNIGGLDDEDDLQRVTPELDKDGNQTILPENFETKRSNVTFENTQMMLVPTGGLVSDTLVYKGQITPLSYPDTAMDKNDYSKRLRFDRLQTLRREEMSFWKRKDIKGIRKNTYIKEIQKKNEKILYVAEKNDLEKLEVYTDRFPLLETRKSLNKLKIFIQMVAYRIQASRTFNNMSITVIGLNSAAMIAQDPTQERGEFFTFAEDMFTLLYSLEMIIKIMGIGFVFDEGSYLRDAWNILDFVIVISSYPAYFEDPNAPTDQSFSLSGLRAFRVMRPLKTISSVKGLKVLMQALFQAMPLLVDTLSILCFFFAIMAIAGTNLMQGTLKKRCVGIQNGMIQPTSDPPFCSNNDSCPGGYFCGKTNENPNYGVTNFDQVMYSFLCVFQSVTLEGWSDVQRDMSKAYTSFIFIYFILLVFIGAFFLLNLTLAVINSEFTKAHKDHISSEAQELAVNNPIQHENDDFENAIDQNDEMSIAQFITARIYAKKMIEFLRMRQLIKRIEHERVKKLKSKEIAFAQAMRRIPLVDAPVKPQDPNQPDDEKLRSMESLINTTKREFKKGFKMISPKIKPGDDVIPEDIANESDGQSDQDQLEKDIKEFLKNSRIHLQRQSHLGKTLKKTDIFIKREEEGGMPQMKGNIGPTSKFKVNCNNFQSQQKALFSKMAEEFAIDKVIPDRNKQTQGSFDGNNCSMGSFKLSIKNEEVESHFNSSNNGEGHKHIPNRMIKGMSDIPGYVNDLNESSGLITSDSNFEMAAGEGHGEGKNIVPLTKKKVNLKKGVSKTFKKMLRQNYNQDRGMFSGNKLDQSNDSTKFGGSYNDQQDICSNANSEIENKFAKKKMKKSLQKIYYKEDDRFNSFIREDKDIKDPHLNYNQPNKDDFLDFKEHINTKRPRDPFKDLNPLMQKVDITADKVYQGTSQNDVFFLRFQKQNENQPLIENKFLMMAPKNQQEEEKQMSQIVLRSNFEAYQQKVVYKHEKDMVEEDVSSDNKLNEDILQAQEQPYVTTASINYNELLKQVPTKELAKRSDIMITSTLSMSLFPKDKRIIMTKYRAKLSTDPTEFFSISSLVNEKNAFNALVKEHYYQSGLTKDKDKDYSDAFMKSFIHRSTFKSLTLKTFKENVKKLNSNAKAIKVKDITIIKLEKLKFDQNKRASQKRGIQKWDVELATRLLEGKYWDLDEEEEPASIIAQKMQVNNNKSIIAKNREEMQKKNLIENFENHLRDIIRDNESQRIKFSSEIPTEYKKKYNLLNKMGPYVLNFNEIKKQDISLKRQQPMWSGQDVLEYTLDEKKSRYINSQINSNRVWPMGGSGIYKRLRFQLRIIVKSSLFDSSMTFAVLLNTITLSMDHYLISTELLSFLDILNVYFTWIFIFEMFSKIVAVGIDKYASDRMNYLDGSVVMLSIIEMTAETILSGENLGLSSFKTIRMLRTFRVFRIARLLKALESMKTIMDVIMRSYKSFIYITLLMFLFIFIFSLLGMQTFGGQFNYEDGVPKNNYDQFSIAFITVFQVLTMENWQTVLFDSMRSETVNPYMIAIYYIAWVFLGNFILLNLFLAILLDSFLDDEEDDEEAMKELQNDMKKKLEQIKNKKKKDNSNKLLMDVGNKQKEGQIKMFLLQNQIQEDEDLEDLDEDQIVQIYKEEGLFSKSEEELRSIKDFINIDCQASIYLFSQENLFRLMCYKIIKFKYWEKIIQFLIMLSSLKLAIDTYFLNEKKGSITLDVSMYIDFGFNFLFFIEMFLSIIAMGLIMDSGSYLRESWNRLDFFIVITSIIDMSLTGADLGIIKIFRMLRVLRPLRFINHNVNLKMVVVALLDSMSSIFNVVIVIAVVYLIFAILGVSFFGGKLQYCSIDMYKVQTDQECMLLLGQWMTWDYNFDDVKQAMISLFVVSSLESWPDIMQQTLDITGMEMGPTPESSLVYMTFFVLFILIGSFFFLNFFIGVLFLKFNQAQREEQKGFSAEDLVWQDIQKLIVTAQPEYESTNVPDIAWRIYFHDLVISKKFEIFITVAILLNMLQMSLLHENQTIQFTWFMDFTNYIFTFIFLVETILKLFAFSRSYFNNAWNQFDFFVVIASIFDIMLKFLENLITGGGFLAVAPQIARIMRVLRVTRILRLLNKAEGLQAIIQTIAFSITPLSNVIILLLLIYFMFAILGNFLFYDIKQGNGMDDFVNFETFDKAFLLLFSISTGENWPIIMQDCSRTQADGCIEGVSCGNPLWAFVYFFLMVLICSYVMLNLFILVIIQQFDKYFIPKENMIAKFKTDLTNFLKVWKKYTQKKFKCKKIKESQLPKFFRELGETGDIDTNLGFHKDYYNDGELKKNLLKMGIKSDQGSIYFNELLYRCMRRRYGNMKINKKMQIIELLTQYKIYQITLREKNQNTKTINNDDIYNNIVKKENAMNPFLTIMNFKISFRTWLKFAKKRVRSELRLTAQELGQMHLIEDESSDDDDENKKPYAVEIDIEHQYSCTSDEESEADVLGSQSNKQQLLKSHKDTGSAYGSQNSKDGMRSMKMSENKKKQDHLKMFEKKMTQRFKQSNTITGKNSPRSRTTYK